MSCEQIQRVRKFEFHKKKNSGNFQALISSCAVQSLSETSGTIQCLYDLCLVDTTYALMILYALEDLLSWEPEAGSTDK